MTAPSRLLWLILFAVLVAPTAAARAATVSLTHAHSVCGCGDDDAAGIGDDYALRYAAAPGEANALAVTLARGGFTVTDAGAVITARAGCISTGAHAARCRARTHDDIERGGYDADFVSDEADVDLGNGDDSATSSWTPGSAVAGGGIKIAGGAGDDRLAARAGSAVLLGGEGDDVLIGGPRGDVLFGGPGSDVERGGAGDDDLAGEGPATLAELAGTAAHALYPPDADVLDGGPGQDRARYGDHAAPVTVDLRRAGAQCGAGGDVLRGIEDVTGGPGDDTLIGDAGANRLDGAGGSDTLVGHAGDDVLDGERLDGGAGDDILGAAAGTPRCGRGRDTIGDVETAPTRRTVVAAACERTALGGDSGWISAHPQRRGTHLRFTLATEVDGLPPARLTVTASGRRLATGRIQYPRGGRTARRGAVRLTPAGRQLLRRGTLPRAVVHVSGDASVEFTTTL